MATELSLTDAAAKVGVKFGRVLELHCVVSGCWSSSFSVFSPAPLDVVFACLGGFCLGLALCVEIGGADPATWSDGFCSTLCSHTVAGEMVL